MNEVIGRVIEILPKGIFKVECEVDGLTILCKLSLEIIKTCISPRILIGDLVVVRVSSHNLNDGEIVRHLI